MKKLLLIPALLLATACATNEGTATYVYTYGSSITAGMVHPNYAEQFAQAVGLTFPIEKAYGATSLFQGNAQGAPDQYNTIMGDTWSSRSIVLWDAGINDAIINGDDAAYEAKFTQGVQDVINHFEKSGVKVFVATPNHNCNEARFGTNELMDKYGAIVKKLVSEKNNANIVLVDFGDEFNPTTSNTVDCIHPNVEGYKQMASVLQEIYAGGDK